jgi:malate dehydrogenase (oxaloacetate-decarboxylating)
MACFNDDVQGTGAVTLAAIRSALHISQIKMKDLRVVMFGAGTAGTGIADQILDAISVETEKSKEEAGLQIWYEYPRVILLALVSHLLIFQQVC